MNFPPDRHNDNRWNRALDLLIAVWNRHGPDATVDALTALEFSPPAGTEDAATRNEGAA